MTTDEVEALLASYRAAYDATKGLDAAQRAGVEAVASAVRAQDAARGGMLTAEEVRPIVTGWVVGEMPDGRLLVGRDVHAHLAAQGRIIATLEKERNGWRLTAEARDTAATANTTRAEAAEAALATLRQAVLRAEQMCDQARPRAAEDVLRKALDATLSEHPDTATLRAIRERAKDRKGLVDAHLSETGSGSKIRAVVEFLLGDSGPSGGEKQCCYGGQREVACAESCPTIPPDVAASEQKPTPEEDWRTVEEALRDLYGYGHRREAANGTVVQEKAQRVLARLKAEPRRAAEAMRERCAAAAPGLVLEWRLKDGAGQCGGFVATGLRAIPL